MEKLTISAPTDEKIWRRRRRTCLRKLSDEELEEIKNFIEGHFSKRKSFDNSEIIIELEKKFNLRIRVKNISALFRKLGLHQKIERRRVTVHSKISVSYRLKSETIHETATNQPEEEITEKNQQNNETLFYSCNPKFEGEYKSRGENRLCSWQDTCNQKLSGWKRKRKNIYELKRFSSFSFKNHFASIKKP